MTLEKVAASTARALPARRAPSITSSGSFPVNRGSDDTGVRRMLSSLPPPPAIPAARLRKDAAKSPAPVVRARLRPVTDTDLTAAEDREWMALFAEAKRAIAEEEDAEWKLLKARADQAAREAEAREWQMLRAKADARFMRESHGSGHARSHGNVIAWP